MSSSGPDRGPETVVYVARTTRECNVAMDFLMRGGFAPRALDRPSPTVQHRSGYNVKIRIAVPAALATAASRALEEWRERSAPEVRRASATFARQALIAAAVTGAALLAVVLVRGREYLADFAPLTILLFIATLIAVANLPRLRRYLRGRPASGGDPRER